MRYYLLLLFILSITFSSYSQNESKPKRTKKSKASPVKAGPAIKWKTLEEVEQLMVATPKKVYIDLYTDWCGWCKVMDKKTFTNRNVADYMNEHYYAVHLDAESADSIRFKGKNYGRVDGSKTNELAADFMNNRLSYPTSIFFDENFTNPQPVPGYLDVNTMEMIMKYIATNQHKTVPFEKYKNEFKGSW